MKTAKHISKIAIALSISLLFFTSCSTEDDGVGEGTSPDANTINEYILGLSFNHEELLNTQNLQDGESNRDEGEPYNDDSIPSSPQQGTVTSCSLTDVSLATNFDDVAILRPTADVIYPGALVLADDNLWGGAPMPLAVDRAPVTLRVDLPGIGSNGNIEVENPNLATVDAALDDALEWWNDNAYVDGHRNGANSIYKAATAYSSRQLAIDVGLAMEWATGSSMEAQLGYESNTERRVATLVYKQEFYRVNMPTPLSPAAVFGSGTTLPQVQALINSDAPPAYVSSVSYGRIIMLRMESTNMDTSISLDAVLKYASGVGQGIGTINSTFDEVISESTIDLITLGGNAEVAASAIDLANIEEGPGSISHLINGENAYYSRNNPGVPIAYTVRLLQDNTLAKMGYTTDYSIRTCSLTPFNHAQVNVENNSFHDCRFRFRYKGQNSDIYYNSAYYYLDQDERLTRVPPSGAHEVEIQFEYQYGGGDYNYIGRELPPTGYLYFEDCYEFYGGNIFGEPAEFQDIVCD